MSISVLGLGSCIGSDAIDENKERRCSAAVLKSLIMDVCAYASGLVSSGPRKSPDKP